MVIDLTLISKKKKKKSFKISELHIITWLLILAVFLMYLTPTASKYLLLSAMKGKQLNKIATSFYLCSA